MPHLSSIVLNHSSFPVDAFSEEASQQAPKAGDLHNESADGGESCIPQRAITFGPGQKADKDSAPGEGQPTDRTAKNTSKGFIAIVIKNTVISARKPEKRKDCEPRRFMPCHICVLSRYMRTLAACSPRIICTL